MQGMQAHASNLHIQKNTQIRCSRLVFAMTNYAETLDDLFQDVERQIEEDKKNRRDPMETYNVEPAMNMGTAKLPPPPDPAASFQSYRQFGGVPAFSKATRKSKTHPFGIEITSETIHSANNIRVFTLMSLSLWELIPQEDRKEIRKIKVVQDMARMMTGQILIPWYKRYKRHVADWLVDLQLSGGYSCHVATHSYKTHLDHDIMAVTLLVRRVSAKEDAPGADKMHAITGTIVFVMNDTSEEDKEADKFLRDFLEHTCSDKEFPEVKDNDEPKKHRSDAVTPRAPNSTEMLDRYGTFLNFFFEIATISYEVEARSIGDVC